MFGLMRSLLVHVTNTKICAERTSHLSMLRASLCRFVVHFTSIVPFKHIWGLIINHEGCFVFGAYNRHMIQQVVYKIFHDSQTRRSISYVGIVAIW